VTDEQLTDFTRRAELTLAYLRSAIEEMLTSRRPDHGPAEAS
jgi:hypothetical protein